MMITVPEWVLWGGVCLIVVSLMSLGLLFLWLLWKGRKVDLKINW